MSDQISKEAAQAHWRATSSLMWFCLAIWAIFSFGVHFFVNELNGMFEDFHLGYYMASQGSLIVFVIAIFFFAARQNAIDEKYGAGEE